MKDKRVGERIERTLELYDPKMTGIAVGTVAIRWAGVRVGVSDVDQLQPPEGVLELERRLLVDGIGGTTFFASTAEYPDAAGEHVSLEPRKHLTNTLLPYQAFSAIKDKLHEMDYEGAKAVAVLNEESGRMALPLFEALLWKAKVGRGKDIDLVRSTLGKSEVRAMLTDGELQDLQEALRTHQT